MSASLRMTERSWKQIRAHARPSFAEGRSEQGLLGLFAENQLRNRHEALLVELLAPRQGDIHADEEHVTFSSTYLRRAHLEARHRGLAGIVAVHTHPRARDKVAFSAYDDAQEPELVANLQDIAPATRLLSLVLGKNTQCARLWTMPTAALALDHLVTVGEALAFHPLNGEPEPPPPPAGAAFDRSLAVTGQGALGVLRRMRIAVVGASGTGSIVAELLTRAGCGELVLIDPDRVEGFNLNRILNSRSGDIGAFKVDVLKERLEAIGLGCHVKAVPDSVLSADGLEELRDADIVFGCLDNQALPRLALSHYAYQYLRPVIDLGTEIGTDRNGNVVSLDARVSYVAAGRPCLRCQGIIDPERLALETQSSAEGRRVREQGYAEHLLLARPAVMDLNMRAASLATTLLRHLLQPFLNTPLPLAFHEEVVMFSRHHVATPRAANEQCDICSANPNFALGPMATGGLQSVASVGRKAPPEPSADLALPRRTSKHGG